MKPLIALLLLCTTASAQHPLPAWSPWNSDFQNPAGYSPDWQYERLQSGEHGIPSFECHSSFDPGFRIRHAEYWDPLWSHAKRNRLPVMFVGQNFAELFRTHEPWSLMTIGDPHPFVQKADGTIVKVASPWSRDSLICFYDLGSFVGRFLAAFADDYPDPPEVFLFDNNEVGFADYWQAVSDARMPADLRNIRNAFAGESSEEQQAVRQALNDGHRARYAEFRRGLRDALPDGWKKIRFVGYAQFGSYFCGSEYLPDLYRNREPWGDAGGFNNVSGFDGVSNDVGYVHSWSNHGIGKVRSPQVEACNSRYAVERFRAEVNPDFVHVPIYWNGKHDSPDRYLGMVRCVQWITREPYCQWYTGTMQTVDETYASDAEPLMTAVEEVWNNPTLSDFWQHGKLLRCRWSSMETPQTPWYTVPAGYGHPYWWMRPAEDVDLADRWFLQHVPLNNRVQLSGTFWTDAWRNDRTHETPVNVFAICLELDGSYLVYAHAPNGAVEDCEIQVCPESETPLLSVTVDVPVEGAFWLWSPARAMIPAAPESIEKVN